MTSRALLRAASSGSVNLSGEYCVADIRSANPLGRMSIHGGEVRVFFSHLGISADRLAASMLRHTSECMTIAVASAHTTIISSFEYISRFGRSIVQTGRFQDLLTPHFYGFFVSPASARDCRLAFLRASMGEWLLSILRFSALRVRIGC
jgi:hypothetical protein